MTYTNICVCLDGYWGKPWLELPVEQRQAWLKVYPLTPYPIREGDETNGEWWWNELNPVGRKAQAERFDYKNDPAHEGERHVARHDVSMNARTWFDMPDVEPRDAAMVLCRYNPDKGDPDYYVDGDESSPERYRLLLAMFESVARSLPKHRTLIEWRAIAQENGLRYHEWIDKYEQARIEAADSAGEGDAVRNSAGGTATTPSLTEIRIAAIVEIATQLKYDPLSVATGGKAIIKAECLEKFNGAPQRFTADTFKRAWQAARDAGRIDVENVEIYRGQ